MGEVYKARDSKLGREVAIKVLPEAFAENKERLARFEREARLLASLNHPNIATLFDLQESDGVHFLVLEYVPGETLAERIKRGPIPVDDALPLFKQIAEGLEAAHEKGIIHRDLKPANIKVTPEEKVKVLDFGLAKALVGERPVQDLSESPTIAREATDEGVLLGTAAYMSPEQARGKAVDRRTDIWAFGCVLYEALTGRKAFYGETVSDTLVSILEHEPDWPALPDTMPASVQDLLHRCLRKDVNRRFRDVWDVRVEIEEVSTGPSARPASRQFRGTTQHARAISWKAAGLAAVLLSITAALTVWIFLGSRTPKQAKPTHLIVNVLPTGQFTSGPGHMLALSPDGARLVYVLSYGGESRLFLRTLDRLQADPIPGTEGAHHPFFSPDSQWIGFFSEGKLKKVSLTGGAPYTVCEAGSVPRGASWASDGRIFFATEGSGISSVSDSGGTPQTVTKPDLDKGRRSTALHGLDGSFL
jgi:serine/threonine protein kinase